MRCEECSGDVVGGRCTNCGTEFEILEVDQVEEIPEMPSATPEDVAAGFRALLELSGAGPEAAALPEAAVTQLLALTSGYDEDPSELLADADLDPSDDRVHVEAEMPRIPFTSLCCDHGSPFAGFVRVEIRPGERTATPEVVARVVDTLSRRFQRPGRLAVQIAGVLSRGLSSETAVELQVKRCCIGCSGPHESQLPAVFRARCLGE